MEQAWEQNRETWAIQKGFLHSVAANMHDALDENWYSQLKHLHTTYRNVQPIQILEHLNTQWCLFDVHAKKIIKAKYWTKWDGDIHLTAFGKCLNDKQICIEHFGINISNEDKLQFYLGQMYSCNQLNQTQMIAWENMTEAIKTNWTETKQYFKGLVRGFKIYEQNSSSNTGKGKYKSANQVTEAAKGDKLRHCITTIVAAAIAKDDKEDKIATNICDIAQKKTDKMAMQLKLLSKAMAGRHSSR
jgi:hypothetical protein